MSLEEILGRASWPDGPSASSPAPRPLRRRRGVLLAAAVLGLVVVADIAYRLHRYMGGPEMAPQTPQRSSRPGEAVALLGHARVIRTPQRSSLPGEAVPLLGHARVIRTAQTLYSGIFDDGSNAALVRKLAAESPSFTNGTKIAPGFTASVTRA